MHILNGLSGGGQMLRTALTLSMITGEAFRMTEIRGKRQRPGLMRQHLTCVKAAAAICDATVDGAEIGSTSIVFRPGKLRGGDYQFAIGTAGSTGLLFQTLFPALCHADAPSTLLLEGGTHNPLAPPFEFLESVFLPAVARLGFGGNLELLESGFAPVGGGIVRASVQPSGKLSPCDLIDRGALRKLTIRVPVRNLPVSIAERIRDTAHAIFPDADAAVELREPGPGRGVCVLIGSEFEHHTEMTSAFGEQGVSAEKVALRAARSMRDFIATGAAIGRCLADQLLLPMALAGGGGFLTMPVDDHVPTNIGVIEKFLPIGIRHDPAGSGLVRMTLGPA